MSFHLDPHNLPNLTIETITTQHIITLHLLLLLLYRLLLYRLLTNTNTNHHSTLIITPSIHSIPSMNYTSILLIQLIHDLYKSVLWNMTRPINPILIQKVISTLIEMIIYFELMSCYSSYISVISIVEDRFTMVEEGGL